MMQWTCLREISDKGFVHNMRDYKLLLTRRQAPYFRGNINLNANR